MMTPASERLLLCANTEVRGLLWCMRAVSFGSPNVLSRSLSVWVCLVVRDWRGCASPGEPSFTGLPERRSKRYEPAMCPNLCATTKTTSLSVHIHDFHAIETRVHFIVAGKTYQSPNLLSSATRTRTRATLFFFLVLRLLPRDRTFA